VHHAGLTFVALHLAQLMLLALALLGCAASDDRQAICEAALKNALRFPESFKPMTAGVAKSGPNLSMAFEASNPAGRTIPASGRCEFYSFGINPDLKSISLTTDDVSILAKTAARQRQCALTRSMLARKSHTSE
jgi:hypothetical protein